MTEVILHKPSPILKTRRVSVSIIQTKRLDGIFRGKTKEVILLGDNNMIIIKNRRRK